MKSLLLLLAMLFAVNFSYAQNTYPWPSTGNIGIGTITPDGAYQLTLSGNGTSTPVAGISFKQGGNSGFFVGYPGATDNTNIELFNANNGYMRFATNNAERMRIDNAGNVGIGTTSPNGKLDVNGAILLQGATSNTMSRPAVTATRISGEITSYSTGGANYDDGLLRLSAGGGTNAIVKTFIDLSGYSTIPDMNRNIVLGTAGTERMRIDASGNVGIGTTSPDQKLTVNGTIHAKEVKVDLSVPAPDYVFEKSYKLKSLPEVAKYVALNKHLSEIPSAKVMEQNGVNVSELNMKLLQKVEELTLYLIQENKEKKEQQNQIDQLKQQVETLMKRNP